MSSGGSIIRQDAAAGTTAGRLHPSRALSGRSAAIAVACGLAMFLDGYDIQVMALIVPALTHDWGGHASDYGYALSASIAGMVAGSALLGPLGDRVGRRPIVCAALLAIGCAMLGTVTAHGPGGFILWRLLTGLGLGACIPNCNALVSDVVPPSIRSRVLVPMNAAIGLGATAAGFITPFAAAWSWRAAFVLGGIASLLLAGALTALRDDPPPRAATPDRSTGMATVAVPWAGMRTLLGSALRSRTLLIWAMFALNTYSLFLLLSWLPALLTGLGWKFSAALHAEAAIQIGGVIGGCALSFLLDRRLIRTSTAGAWLVAGVALFAMAFTPAMVVPWTLLLLAVGVGVSGGQLCVNVLGSLWYPAAVRATALSSMGVVGSLGSICGPLAGAAMLRHGWSAQWVLLSLIPPIVASVVAALFCRPAWVQA